jgi:hypothetical protein
MVIVMIIACLWCWNFLEYATMSKLIQPDRGEGLILVLLKNKNSWTFIGNSIYIFLKLKT